MGALWQFLHPLFASPLFIKIAVPICGAAWIGETMTRGSDPATWQGKVNTVSHAVLGICTAAGIASSMPGVSAAAKVASDSDTPFFDPNS